MPEAGFFERKSISPASLAVVVAMHAAAIAALALSKIETPSDPFKRIELIPIQTDPPPPPVDKVEDVPKARSPVTLPIPEVPRPIDDAPVFERIPDIPVPDFPALPGNDPVDSTPAQSDPIREPVRVEARMDSRSELQPPYPPAEERAGTEGQVKVRVRIGADGRVQAVEKISATSDAFFRATERHARHGWKFKPATVDGKPVESWKVVTVRFRLDD